MSQSEQHEKAKRGKPKKSNTQHIKNISNEWSSSETCIKIVQTLTRFGRFLNFQQTGGKAEKKVKKDQSDQHDLQNQEIGTFLGNDTIQLMQNIAELCNISQQNNKNCFVFFFSTDYPSYIIEDGVPKLNENIYENINDESLRKLAPLLQKKFLNECQNYLNDNPGFKLLQKEQNKQLETADTILQCNFATYYLQHHIQDNVYDKNIIQNSFTNYLEFDQTEIKYQDNIDQLLSCWQQSNDLQYQDHQN